MKKNFKENYKDKVISLVFKDSKQTDFYENWAYMFSPELFNAIKAKIDGDNPSLVLRRSLECYGLSSRQEEELVAILPYFEVSDRKKGLNLVMKKAWTFPHFEIPNFLQEDKKLAIGFAVGLILVIAVPLLAVYMDKETKSTNEIAMATESVKTEQTAPTPPPPSRFQDLMIRDVEAPSTCTTATGFTDNEPVIADEVEEKAAASLTATNSTIEQIRTLILADDEQRLSELFAGRRIKIETADGYLSDYVSEKASELIRSGKVISLMYDSDTPSLLKKIIIGD